MALPPGSRLTCADHKPTLNALNAHAGVISSKFEEGSGGFYAKFAEFIKLLEESDFDDIFGRWRAYFGDSRLLAFPPSCHLFVYVQEKEGGGKQIKEQRKRRKRSDEKKKG